MEEVTDHLDIPEIDEAEEDADAEGSFNPSQENSESEQE